MADHEGITDVQSFSERTLKYGRNMMVTAVTLNVFAWSDSIDLANSRPLNFEIREGSEIMIWIFLLVILIYYAFRFYGLAFPDFFNWKTEHGEFVSIREKRIVIYLNSLEELPEKLKLQNQALRDTNSETQQGEHRSQINRFKGDIQNNLNGLHESRTEIRNYRWRRTYFWLVDAGVPTALFLGALAGASWRIYQLMGPDLGPPYWG